MNVVHDVGGPFAVQLYEDGDNIYVGMHENTSLESLPQKK